MVGESEGHRGGYEVTGLGYLGDYSLAFPLFAATLAFPLALASPTLRARLNAPAALLAITCNPPDCAMTRPEPMPASVQQWQARWSGHPGVGWVLRTYREHRPASRAL